MELSTCNSIIEWFKNQAQEKLPIDPMRYIEAAEKLNVLKSDETDTLIDLQQAVAVMKIEILDNDKVSSTEAKTRVEATGTYVQMRRQEMKVKQIEEFIRLAKLHGRLKSEELRSGL